MKKELLLQGLMKLIGGLAAVGLLLFWPAGTLAYGNAWLFIVLLFLPMIAVGAALVTKAPELLAKRLNTKEQEPEQKRVVLLSSVIYITGFILAGLDFRFGWSPIPRWLTIAAAVLQLASYGLYAEVMRENAFLSRTVEIQENQRVVDTGLYGLVRHPMYLATVLLNFAIPLVLGSWVALIPFLFYPALIRKRIQNEEKVLEQGLEGYKAYQAKVRYRLIPYIW